jgi:hypothetical protein
MEVVVTEQIDVGVPGLRLRFATAADIGLILDFIPQLAEYERLGTRPMDE